MRTIATLFVVFVVGTVGAYHNGAISGVAEAIGFGCVWVTWVVLELRSAAVDD